MCVYVCVCMYVCVCVHVDVRKGLFVCMYVCVYVCVGGPCSILIAFLGILQALSRATESR